MKFDCIIIGGGLSGLTAGITLARAGKRTAIISAGQSALHFGSGSFELLGHTGQNDVINPIEAIDELPSIHPYRRIGKARIAELVSRVQPMLSDAGISTNGDAYRNRYRLTPLGKFKPAWLTLDDFATFDSPDRLPWRRVALVNIDDFMDFYPQFLAAGLEKHGVTCSFHSVTVPALDKLSRSVTEMRAPNIARVLDDDAIRSLAVRISEIARGSDAVIMPAVAGMYDDRPVRLLRNHADKPVYFMTTMPTSVPGVRTQIQLCNYFKKLGGTYILGDNVTSGKTAGDRLVHVNTTNHGNEPLAADYYIIATGSFFGNGLIANPDRIIEPILDLDVDAPTDRAQWYDKDIYAPQPFMSYGVMTDGEFRPSISGATVSNLYAAGSLTGGCNPLKEGCGAGVAMLTAMAVADNILKR